MKNLPALNGVNWTTNPQWDPSIANRQRQLAAIEQLTTPAIINNVTRFHQSIPNYQASPLISLNNLAKNLGLGQIWVKDESQRFDLNAFKVLGASYAMASQLHQQLNDPNLPLDFKSLKQRQSDYAQVEFATATDGNHGRAVAWSAFHFGCAAHVYMPKGSSPTRLKEISRFAQTATITPYNYDDTVKYVASLAQENHWILLQDTAWPGYEEIPIQIMQGYFSLIKEFHEQSKNASPSHVFLQAGVGSMAAAIAAYFVVHPNPTPKIILVEPNNAPCFFQSIQINDGKPHRYCGEMQTIMAGLACGEPSTLAWEIIQSVGDSFLICDDTTAVKGMWRYAHPLGDDSKIISGESAAVTLGLLETLMLDAEQASIREALALDEDSQVLLLSTEGDTDPGMYQNLLKSAEEQYGGT